MHARWNTFNALAPYFGKVVPASFIQKTAQTIPSVERIHNLYQGIYKPKDSLYALAIASMLKNPYADRVEYMDDRTWSFYYSPKKGSLDSAVNLSLFKCMADSEPVLVIKQLSDKTHRLGARYRLMGLGLIDRFDDVQQLFRIRELTIDEFQRRIGRGAVLEDHLIETALQLEALEDWSAFVSEDRAIYRVSRVKRDAAFRKIVLENYENTCAITRSSFVSGEVVEAQAAHIVSKQVNGSDDPRNGIAMSHTAHWAFDQGIFTISDQYEIMVHPTATRLNAANFEILRLDRMPILQPSEDFYLPHEEALRWHREEVYGVFAG